MLQQNDIVFDNKSIMLVISESKVYRLKESHLEKLKDIIVLQKYGETYLLVFVNLCLFCFYGI